MPDPEAAPLQRTDASGDAVLLERLRQGDGDAFETLVRKEMPRLLATARRLLRSEEDAKDAVQETFVSAFRSIDAFEGAARLSTWFHRITVNACLMKMRSRRRRPEDPIDPFLPQFLEDGHHTTHTPEWRDDALALMERREEREFVRARIDELPESYRTVLILRDIEELEPAETATILGVSENLVKVRLHRARQALRALLEPRYRRA